MKQMKEYVKPRLDLIHIDCESILQIGSSLEALKLSANDAQEILGKKKDLIIEDEEFDEEW